MAEDWLALNRANWDERVPVHLTSCDYDLTALRAGRHRLDVLTEAMPPPLAGLRVLHLQCRFGRDTLVLAGRGAEVTGVDFSPPAIAAAQDLAPWCSTTGHWAGTDGPAGSCPTSGR